MGSAFNAYSDEVAANQSLILQGDEAFQYIAVFGEAYQVIIVDRQNPLL